MLWLSLLWQSMWKESTPKYHTEIVQTEAEDESGVWSATLYRSGVPYSHVQVFSFSELSAQSN